jgi:hypothetical protein
MHSFIALVKFQCASRELLLVLSYKHRLTISFLCQPIRSTGPQLTSEKPNTPTTAATTHALSSSRASSCPQASLSTSEFYVEFQLRKITETYKTYGASTISSQEVDYCRLWWTAHVFSSRFT